MLTVLLATPAQAARRAFWSTWVEPQNGASQLQLLRRLERSMGRNFHGVRLYHPLDHSRMRSPVLDLMRHRHQPLYLNVTSEVNRNQCVPWGDVASGRYNADLHTLARHVKRWPAKVFFSWNHEFLNDCTSGTPADYVASYHRVHKVFRHDHVQNVVFVWTATAHNFHQDGALLRQYQPRRYDVVGVDGYNKTGDWVSAKDLFSYAHKFAVRHHKGFMIGEVGSAEDPERRDGKGQVDPKRGRDLQGMAGAHGGVDEHQRLLGRLVPVGRRRVPGREPDALLPQVAVLTGRAAPRAPGGA